jgi:hypothetical protein
MDKRSDMQNILYLADTGGKSEIQYYFHTKASHLSLVNLI